MNDSMVWDDLPYCINFKFRMNFYTLKMFISLEKYSNISLENTQNT